jgi:3-dehydroquinate dehydratase type I
VRADHLERIDDDLFRWLEREGDRVLFCCRSKEQGGRFDGTEAERLAILQRAKTRWVDVEHDLPLEGFDRDRVVLSWHDFEGSGRVKARACALAGRGAGVVKLAARVDDAAEIALLEEARHEIEGDAVLIGMGDAGLLSRVRYGALGSAWTYVAADARHVTAPGQLDWAGARVMGLPDAANAPFCALVGGPQVMGSPGTRVYNALYRDLGLDLSYLPILTHSLTDCLPLLDRLGARGLSATMPLKHEALGLCAADELAIAVGSANSMRRTDAGWEGTNTDVAGVRLPLEEAGVRGTALVLGAGGAARAAIHACGQLGLDVAVSARSPRGLEGVVPWQDRGAVKHDVLINATPVAGARSPWPNDVPLARCVFDLAIAPKSALLDRARREGRVAIDATRMWIHQGAEQMSWMLDRSISASQLEELL